MTNRGLGIHNNPNIELLGYHNQLHSDLRIWVYKTILNSTLVDNNIYLLYKDWMSKQNIEKDKPSVPILQYANCLNKYFLLSHMPASLSPTRMWRIANDKDIKFHEWGELQAFEHDVALYEIMPDPEISIFINRLKDRFFSHPFIYEFSKQITKDGLRFGEVKEWFHKNCKTVPLPYKREFTPHIQSLYKWFTELAPEIYEIIQPRHTEIIRLR